jgi:hypothetical protein
MSVLPLEMFVELNESQISEYKCHLGSFLKTDVIGSTAYHEITDFSIDMSDLNSITMHGDSIELSPSQNDDKDWRLQCSDFNLELKHFMPTKSQSMIQKIIETLPRDRTGHFKKVIQHCRVVATLSENDQVSDVWIGRDLSLRFERAWPENVMSTDLSNLSEVNFHDTPISTIKLRNPDEEVRVFEIAKHPAGRVWLQAAVQSFKDWNDIGIDEPWSAETRILAIHSKSAIEDLGSTIRFFIMPDETVTIDVALETDTRCIHRGGLPVMFSLNGGQFLGAARLPNDYYVGFFYGFDESFTIDESLDWDNETKRALGGKVICFLKTNLHSGRINDHRAGPGWAPSANWRSNHTENEAPSVHENGVHEFRPELGAHYPYSCWRPYSQRITEEQVR